jgi:hypothetical protein
MFGYLFCGAIGALAMLVLMGILNAARDQYPDVFCEDCPLLKRREP